MLSSLTLSGNPIGNFGILTLAQVLPHSPLRELYLSNIGMTTEGFQCLARVLRFTTSLTLLDISKNVLGYSGLNPLIDQLPYTQITNLNIKGSDRFHFIHYIQLSYKIQKWTI